MSTSLVLDRHTVYSLMGGIDPSAKKNEVK